MQSDTAVLQVKSTTWNRDSHELFDYESEHVFRKLYLIKSPAKVFRSNLDVSIIPEGAQLPPLGDYLLAVKKRDGRFYISPADKNMAGSSPQVLPKKLWLIIKHLRGGSFSLSELDIIKLGRFKLKVKQICCEAGENGQVDFRLDEGDIPVTDLSLEELSTMQCRICLLEGGSQEDPLVRPCQCKGSIMYVHVGCLRHWVKNRLNLGDDPHRPCYFVKQLQCELCKTFLPSAVKTGSTRVPIVKLPYIQPPVIVLENLVGPANKGYHICSMSSRKECKLGRGHDSDVRIADVSISRFHAMIKFNEGQFTLEDHTSKFGTLVALRKPTIVEGPDSLAVQVGRTVLEFTMEEAPPGIAFEDFIEIKEKKDDPNDVGTSPDSEDGAAKAEDQNKQQVLGTFNDGHGGGGNVGGPSPLENEMLRAVLPLLQQQQQRTLSNQQQYHFEEQQQQQQPQQFVRGLEGVDHNMSALRMTDEPHASAQQQQPPYVGLWQASGTTRFDSSNSSGLPGTASSIRVRSGGQPSVSVFPDGSSSGPLSPRSSNRPREVSAMELSQAGGASVTTVRMPSNDPYLTGTNSHYYTGVNNGGRKGYNTTASQVMITQENLQVGGPRGSQPQQQMVDEFHSPIVHQLSLPYIGDNRMSIPQIGGNEARHQFVTTQQKSSPRAQHEANLPVLNINDDCVEQITRYFHHHFLNRDDSNISAHLGHTVSAEPHPADHATAAHSSGHASSGVMIMVDGSERRQQQQQQQPSPMHEVQRHQPDEMCEVGRFQDRPPLSPRSAASESIPAIVLGRTFSTPQNEWSRATPPPAAAAAPAPAALCGNNTNNSGTFPTAELQQQTAAVRRIFEFPRDLTGGYSATDSTTRM